MDSSKDFDNLIEKLKNGDPLAFDEIYRRCYGHILFVSSKLCDSKEDAEEVAQDTFVTAFKKANELRSDTIMAYLRKIAANRCYHKRKKNGTKPEYIVYSGEQVENYAELDTDFLPEKYLQNKENRIELMQIVEELPRNQREMIYLYYYLDINTAEIAKLLDCREGNVRQALYMGRKTIKSKLEGADKKETIKHMAVVPLASALHMEAEIFSAEYASVTIAGTLGLFGTAAGTSTAAAGSVTATAVAASNVTAIAASVVAAGVISVTAYFTLFVDTEIYEVQEPAVPASISVLEDESDAVADEPDEPEPPLLPEESEEPAAQLEFELSCIQYETEPETYEISHVYEVPEPPIYIVEDTATEYIEDTAAEYTEETDTPIQEYVPEEYEPPPAEAEPEAAETLDEEDEPPEPEPIWVDRTAEILAALAAADTAADVTHIINHYGFTFADHMRRNSTNEQFRFYVTNEGSGDILIGISTFENGTGRRMRFEHFNNGTMPLDILELLQFMEQ